MERRPFSVILCQPLFFLFFSRRPECTSLHSLLQFFSRSFRAGPPHLIRSRPCLRVYGQPSRLTTGVKNRRTGVSLRKARFSFAKRNASFIYMCIYNLGKKKWKSVIFTKFNFLLSFFFLGCGAPHLFYFYFIFRGVWGRNVGDRPKGGPGGGPRSFAPPTPLHDFDPRPDSRAFNHEPPVIPSRPMK